MDNKMTKLTKITNWMFSGFQPGCSLDFRLDFTLDVPRCLLENHLPVFV
jgi:hypothetical protein